MRQIKRLLFLLLLLSMVDNPCFAHIFTNDSIPDAIPPDSVFNTMAMRKFVVVNLESNAPVRDLLVYTDDGQEAKTKWDGTFALHETFKRVDFVHPNYEKRYMLREEIKSDTIALIPNLYALNEVVIYGHRRNSNLMNSVKLSKVDAHLLQSQPTGFNILGLMAWGLDEIWLKKARHRKEMKKQKQKMILENY